LVRGVLVMVLTLSGALLVQLLVLSHLQHRSTQATRFAEFRRQLALGTAPSGPADEQGRQLAKGTPVAFLEIPSIGLKELVGEGSSSSVLADGAGHRRDTPFPGQLGTSVIMGRRAAYGGPFADITSLKKGDEIRVTTGQGAFTYRVLGVRREGDPTPQPLAAGGSRIVLATAGGSAYLPEGVVRVDAEIDGTPAVGARPVYTSATLPAADKPLEGDSGTMWALALWLQALTLLAVAAIWSWYRWGRPQTWVVFLPPLLLVGLMTAGEVTRLLPNLL
jgi:sortase (surface protein transpeptidase)